MMMRERRDTVAASPSFRKDPLLEVAFLAEVAGAIRGGTQAEKIGAIMRLSRSIESGAAPKRESAELLCEALRDPDSAVKRNAIIVLARGGGDFIPALLAGLSSDDLPVRSVSAAMIRSIASEDAAAFLRMGERERGMLGRLYEALECHERTVADDAFEALKKIAEGAPILVLGTHEIACGRVQEIERIAIDALRRKGGGLPS